MVSKVMFSDEVHHKAIESGPKRATTWHCGQVTFATAEAIEGAEVMVAAVIDGDEGELMAVDKLPFIFADSGCQSLPRIHCLEAH